MIKEIRDKVELVTLVVYFNQLTLAESHVFTLQDHLFFPYLQCDIDQTIPMPLDNIYHRVTFGVIIGLHLAFVLYRWVKKKVVFQANVAKIRRLWIYPIKGVPGISVDRVVMNPSGLEYFWSPSSSSSKMVLRDREYVLLNADSRMITQRQEPRLSLIKVSLNEKEGSLTLSAPGMDEALVINTTSRGTEEVIKFK